MAPPARAPARPPALGDTIRPLNRPGAIEVRVDAAGQPFAARRAGWPAARRVARVQDRWRIDDGWWRAHPVSRAYYTLLLVDGAVVTVYHDLIADAWFEQRG
jgi:hypothetical protein